ncbi:TPA: hypothetical protein I8Y22_002088 [Raoultella planticola]|nr:hypothetical protein [Raoultella planticola]
MTRLLLVCLLLSMSASSSQKPFPGIIFIKNSCDALLSVSVSKFSGYISSLEGNADEHFTLAVGQQKAFDQFQRSSKEQDLEWLFSDEYGGGFNLTTGDGDHQKKYSGANNTLC